VSRVTAVLVGIAVLASCLTCLPACQSRQDKALTTVRKELAVRGAAGARSIQLLKKGQEARDASQPEQARKCLAQAVLEDDRNAVAWMALGALEYEQGKYYEAACAFHRASRLEPSRYEPHFNIGLVMESAGLYFKAIPAYESALKLSGEQLEVMEHLARCYVRTGTNLRKARELVDKAGAVECRPEWLRWLEQASAKLGREMAGSQPACAAADR